MLCVFIKKPLDALGAMANTIGGPTGLIWIYNVGPQNVIWTLVYKPH